MEIKLYWNFCKRVALALPVVLVAVYTFVATLREFSRSNPHLHTLVSLLVAVLAALVAFGLCATVAYVIRETCAFFREALEEERKKARTSEEGVAGANLLVLLRLEGALLREDLSQEETEIIRQFLRRQRRQMGQ